MSSRTSHRRAARMECRDMARSMYEPPSTWAWHHAQAEADLILAEINGDASEITRRRTDLIMLSLYRPFNLES